MKQMSYGMLVCGMLDEHNRIKRCVSDKLICEVVIRITRDYENHLPSWFIKEHHRWIVN